MLLVLSILFVISCSGVDVDFQSAKNRQDHHTAEYVLSLENVLPLRRGEIFTITYQPPSSSSISSFLLTPVDSFTSKSITNQNGAEPITIPFGSTPGDDEWGAWADGNDLLISIPSVAPVSIYTFAIVTEDKSGRQSTQQTGEYLVILFNPWSKQDQVYMQDKNFITEYLEATDGAMWLTRDSDPIGWTWDQFAEDTFIVSLDFLNQLDNFQDRADAIIVSRRFSAFMNANDEGGLLAGRWSEPYTGGKYPWQWTGSGPIFSQFRKTSSYVKWGQCWVFAGVLVSSCRSLGIPARQITNFDSAHEDGSLGPYRLSIDYFSDANGKPQPSLTLGSIWNFHAWAEAWMNRSDIGDESGWQVIDATPQELSDDQYQLGYLN
eukprot:TRINITY_DN8607_c0_g4_i4.p1 TRINITY_DN8607_c0_g4~~TRINITY_DN8607_c0_g4_i4.p1  ORF type:complete len:378 (-),score=53.25 TRINITY_DN8607_c0_g4_i4:1225-2358(-)